MRNQDSGDSRYGYQTVAQEVKRMILSGALPPESRVPMARTLQDQFDVSRITVRRAMDALLQEGWLERNGERLLKVRRRPEDNASQATGGMLQIFFDPFRLDHDDQLFRGALRTLLPASAGGVTVTAMGAGGFREFAERHPGAVSTRAIFFGGYEPDADDAAWLAAHGVKAVVIGRAAPDSGLPQINGSHFQGGWTLTRHLLRHGRRRILLWGRPTGEVVRERVLAGYRRALEEAGVAFDPALVVPLPERGAAAGEHGLRAVLADGPAFDGLIALDNWALCGAVWVLAQAGLSVPGDVGVAAYFYEPWLDDVCRFGVTGTEEDRALLFRGAREAIERLERNEPVPGEIEVANVTLTVRGSCGERPHPAGGAPTPFLTAVANASPRS